MAFVIAPLSKVKGENAYPEFNEAYRALERAAVNQADKDWAPYKMGGLYPGENRYGMTTLRMNEMANDTSANTPSGSYSFSKTYTTGAWRPIFNYTTRKDTLHALLGFRFTDEVLRFSQLRIEISDRIYPIVDIQQAQGWDGFDIIFKEDEGGALIAGQEKRVLVRGYCESTGAQRVVPLGFMLFRRKDLVITEI